MNDTAAETSIENREIVMTRDFDAPRALVFEAWVNAEQLPKWWGPDGFIITIHEMDARPGGLLRFTMHGPDGVDYRDRIVYSEIVRPERLVYQHSGEGEDDSSFQVTVLFEEAEGKTRLTMRTLFPTQEARDFTIGFGAVDLGYQTLAHLADLLAAERAA